ncbi:MAG TPA: alpha/beta hydrolase [Candidatus Paceibacterota bacterium]|nr:alpha/beta hydrolase [Verrucomicrobiota bacterium]HRY50968.1 alpha/beta hydrolase [Candidatus Paceibacterota bacterium]HSA02568.1 alpha/beta hydrolase [Candidatus Paceibacterota bacterium]
MTIRRFLWGILWIGLAFVLVIALGSAAFWWYFHPSVQRQNAIEYGRRGEHSLVLDVLKPSKPNGKGVLVLVSGGWKSGPSGSLGEWIVAPVLRRGYTVFAVYHVSQPESSVMEIIQDMHRAVRFVRHHAKDYGIDPGRLGVTGGSAGGHLSLMLATRGGPGSADAPDPIDRESSAVQAVAIFFPVTDLLNLGKSTENLGDGGPPKTFRRAFGPQGTNLAAWKVIGRESSPIYHVSTNLPPVLIYHGDADTLTPLEQSEWFLEKARASSRTVQLVVHPGGKHGWLTMMFDVHRFADWFDRYLVED